MLTVRSPPCSVLVANLVDVQHDPLRNARILYLNEAANIRPVILEQPVPKGENVQDLLKQCEVGCR
jgi:hypothetical protein